jgi:hypothetical protein
MCGYEIGKDSQGREQIPIGAFLQIACPARLLRDLHKRRGVYGAVLHEDVFGDDIGKLQYASVSRKITISSCTNSGHRPVDGLHSIENESDRSAYFLLTANLKGVQQDRSSTVSKVYPVGAASGAQAESPCHCEMTREGKQGSIAKRWSRRTRSPVEGRIEFRGVG